MRLLSSLSSWIFLHVTLLLISFRRNGGNNYFMAAAFVKLQPVFHLAAPSITNPISISGQRNLVAVSVTFSASDLLYQDQQNAMLRRAQREEELLRSEEGKGSYERLSCPKIKPFQNVSSGTGFGGKNSKISPERRQAKDRAKILKRDGVMRMDNVLSDGVADKLREHILRRQQTVDRLTEEDPKLSMMYYGVENSRKNRCDLHLSLMPSSDDGDADGHVMADVMYELLSGDEGSLTMLYEELVTKKGEFYEVAGIITNRGSDRQMIHPDLPFQVKACPLYVVFLALQDVSEEMGPTSFLLKSHTQKQNDIFFSGNTELKDEQLINANCRLATLNKGDAVIFDARVLHCGGANDGSCRIMFNFSFRNPEIVGDLGYKVNIIL